METITPNDYELIQEFVKGRSACIEQLINRHKNKVYTYILLMVRNEQLAEDIFQDTFIKVIKSLQEGKYKDNGRFLSWVIRIAHNLVIDQYRKEKQIKMISNDNFDADLFNNKKLSDKNIEDELVNVQISEDIRNLIDKLPEEQQQVVILRHFLGLSFKEIADHTDVSINTALGRMRYALINLRKLIREYNVKLSC